MRSILIVEDEKILSDNMAKFLSRNSFDVRASLTIRGAKDLLSKQSFDFVLLDYNLPDGDGLKLLSNIKEEYQDTAVIMITGESSVEIAVNAMKAGADDYLTKPLVLKELAILLAKLDGQQKIKTYRDYHHRRTASNSEIEQIVGQSSQIKQVKERIKQIISADLALDIGDSPSILIGGETGTGKELVAKAIHFSGPHASRPFVEINCSAIPADLLEAELFGHEKGAYTGAQNQRVGLIESAEGGTLFIDEIGDMDIRLQSKLLKVIEDKKYRRLGDTREKTANIRFISATHRDLTQQIKDKLFREDLYYRLKVVAVAVPALRKRSGDIKILAEHFLKEFSNKYKKSGMMLAPQTIEALSDHHWPGNVRELRASIEQAILMNTSNSILPNEFVFTLKASQTFDAPFHIPEKDFSLEAMEQGYIINALDKSDGNITKAAKLLGLTRDTLRYRLEKYSIKQI